MVEIKEIYSIEVLDSRSNPTLMCEVKLTDGSVGCAMAPSGASRGANEAHELRDESSVRYHRRGVQGAVSKINDIIAPALIGMSPFEQQRADSVMITLDGAHNKSNLGANSILSVSLAIASAAASSLGIPLYRYLGGALPSKMPIPMMNVLNGGAHAANNVDIQEFMLAPIGAESFSDSVRMCSEIYHTLKNILKCEGKSSAVGDEGGFAPDLESDEDAIKLLVRAIEESGYRAGADVSIALDAAASEWYSDGAYYLPKRKKRYTSDELCSYFLSLSASYPIISIEDPMGECDVYGWKRISGSLLDKGVGLVGDDLFVTDARRIRDGAGQGIANTVLIKPNQIGSLTECAEAVAVAKGLGYKTVISHRSGETEDSFIADLAVATSSDFVKMGAPARGERTAKYNRLLKIESEIYSPSFGIA